MSPSATRRLLTSDRPIQLHGQLGDERTILTLPIGPDRLFVAGWSAVQVQAIRERGPARLVSRSNQVVSQVEDKFVYGVDDSILEFVRQHFRRGRPKLLAQQLIEHVAARRGPGHLRDS